MCIRDSNYAGFPIGSAAGAAILPASIEGTFAIAAALNVVAAAFALALIPARDDRVARPAPDGG